MGPEVAAERRVHDRLEERAENRGAGPAPAKATAVEEGLTHICIKSSRGKGFFEEPTVHVGESSEVFVEGSEPPVIRRVEDVEESSQAVAEVRAGGSPI